MLTRVEKMFICLCDYKFTHELQRKTRGGFESISFEDQLHVGDRRKLISANVSEATNKSA